MKMKGKIISIVLILSLISIFVPIQDSQIIAKSSTKDYQFNLQSLTSSDPIVITHDDNFTDYTLVGDGSIATPYRIESLNITSTTNETAIKIHHTTKYFIIKNCYLRTLKYGINLFNVSTGTAQIVDNAIEGIEISTGAGIHIKSTNSSFIANNTFLYPEHTGTYSAYLWWAHHTTVFNNTALDYPVYSLLHYIGGFESVSLTIINNTGTNILKGFDLYKCPETVIANNTLYIEYASLAITLDGCPNTMIDNNYLDCDSGSAISVTNSPANITNNILFDAGIYIREFDHTEYRKYKVENNKINNKDFGFFVDIPDIVLDNLEFSQIFLYNCNNAELVNLEFNIPLLHIYAVDCNFLNITSNVFDCEIYYTYGPGDIILRFCQNASVSNNYHHLSGDALYLDNSHNSSFNHNIVYDTGGNGVTLDTSNSSEISYNLFQYAGSGVLIDWNSHHNVIHHNTFIYCPGRDDSSLNVWYDITTMEGNYWSVHSGTGPYVIPGSAGAEDLFPLSTPPVPQISEHNQNKMIYLITTLLSIILIPYISKKRKKINL